ncbi:unnamed protein product [uncultured bacterium]|nr:unnamed protein product [uncultured bacterium]
MGLARRGKDRLDNSSRSGGAFSGARRVARRAPRPNLELLETRVLLSGDPIQQPLDVLVREPLSSAVLVSYVSPDSSITQPEAIAFAESGDLAAPYGPLLLIPDSPAWFGSAVSVPGDQGLAAGPSLLNATVEGGLPTRNGTAAGPLVVALGSNSASIGDRGDASRVAAIELGATLPGSILARYSRAVEPVDGPTVPVQWYAEVQGTLSAGHPSMMIQVPVGQTTSSVGIFVRSATTGFEHGQLPIVERLLLVDVQGQPVDQFAPDPAQGQTAMQAVNVFLHDAPSGGRLLVQITAAENGHTSLPGPGSGSGGDPNWAVSFVLGVQRQEQNSAVQAAVPALGQALVGTLSSGSSPSSGLSPAYDVVVPYSETTFPSAHDGHELVASTPDHSDEGLVNQSVENFNVRLPTGPFASRTSGPQGPIPETLESDLTPAVDRHERGLFQALDGLDDNDSAEMPARRSDLASLDRSIMVRDDQGPASVDPAGGAVVALRGGGGFPIKVTGPSSDQRTEVDALLAALPPMPGTTPQAASLEPASVSMARPQIELDAAAHSSSKRSEFTNYVTAACGLALGLGLTTGPIFPDLLAMFQSRLPGWLASLRPRNWVGQSPPFHRRLVGRFRR